MQTLTHRTNVLLSPDEYEMLLSLSREHGKTMGELIRQAVKKTYKIKAADPFAKSLARIRLLTKGAKVTRQELREWVLTGRKYEN
jgi:meiotically up-regulated gene 157 (Mug157) protein